MSYFRLIQLLPAIYRMIRAIAREIEDGHKNYNVKAKLGLIEEIHKEKNAFLKAKKINELFNEEVS